MARGTRFRISNASSASGRKGRCSAPSSRVSLSSDASSPHRQSHGNDWHGFGTPGGHDEHDDGSNDSLLHEIIMALDMRDGGSMGCAFFTTSTGVLSLSEDLPLADTNIAEHFITHVQPTTLLVSARAPEHLLDYLGKQAVPHNRPDDCPPRFILRALASSDFSPSSAHDRLVDLQLDESLGPSAIFSTAAIGSDDFRPCEQEQAVDNFDPHESANFRLMRFGSLVNLDSQASVTCAGAVLAELHRRRSTGCLPDDGGAAAALEVISIQTFSLANYVFVNAETLQSLQIVHAELHPNSQTWGPDPDKAGGKESLSIYGLFQTLASTPQGRVCLRQLMLRPTVDMETITERHRMIALLLRPENAEKAKQASTILKKIQNMRATVSQLRKGVSYPSTKRSFNRGVWATIRRFAVQTLELRELVGTMCGREEIGAIQKLASSIHQSALVAVGDMIDKTVDFDQSESRRRTSVKAGVNSRLDELKRQYDGMGSFLTQVVNHVNQELPEWASQYIRSCIFLPQVGFLMVVELDPATGNGKYEGEGAGAERWEKLFKADGAVCYKNRHMRELDEQYGDMYCEIGDMEVEIIHHLATTVLKYEMDLVLASDACGDFDAMLALALGAEKYSWTAPRMTRSNMIQIEDGRHPLMELVVPCFVPNDCDLGGNRDTSGPGESEQASVFVLTGPNHSGKSIFLKQVAIIVYLAHVGSFVPAGRAVVGIADKIMTRISTRESMCRTQSAFAIDLRQVAQAMRCSTRMSLVLIDEFGKGTNPDDGAPRLLVATHFHEIFEGRYLNMHDNLLLSHMDVRTDWAAQRTEDQITYLFKLVRGHSSSSFGGRCAALNGVPSAVVGRAEALSLRLSCNEDLSSFCARLSMEEERQLQCAERVARRFLQEDFDEITEGPGQAESTVKAVLCSIISEGS
ncbi:mutS family protein [Hirsutella rhossiliensis]|uniref:MutS family protein n=1 Tax=Hirsutella rhossiliensis TaxID=111463 RepID=A0A9P8MSL1_9HYPO|nr:mutS family protein [Hirsutella rhossiliensis]KAH0960662.1 mutS family protein [Hirsutella rhossiliensis]